MQSCKMFLLRHHRLHYSMQFHIHSFYSNTKVRQDPSWKNNKSPYFCLLIRWSSSLPACMCVLLLSGSLTAPFFLSFHLLFSHFSLYPFSLSAIIVSLFCLPSSLPLCTVSLCLSLSVSMFVSITASLFVYVSPPLYCYVCLSFSLCLSLRPSLLVYLSIFSVSMSATLPVSPSLFLCFSLPMSLSAALYFYVPSSAISLCICCWSIPISVFLRSFLTLSFSLCPYVCRFSSPLSLSLSFCQSAILLLFAHYISLNLLLTHTSIFIPPSLIPFPLFISSFSLPLPFNFFPPFTCNFQASEV